MEPTFRFQSKVWLWDGKAAWHFITVPINISKTIKGFDMPRKGFGSIPVNVTVGKTSWKTSIFPEKKETYLLPLKSAVRKKEKISNEDKIEVNMSIELML